MYPELEQPDLKADFQSVEFSEPAESSLFSRENFVLNSIDNYD